MKLVLSLAAISVFAAVASGQEPGVTIVCNSVQPNVACQLTLQKKVRLLSLPRPVSLTRTDGGREDKLERLEFDAVSLETGEQIHCLADATALSSIDPFLATGATFLLMGWPSAKGALNVKVAGQEDRERRLSVVEVEAGPGNAFAHTLVPTSASQVFHSGNPGQDAVRNLAAALAGASDATLRGITDCLQISAGDAAADRPGENPSRTWIRQTVASVLRGLPQTTPLQRLRIGGLLAQWNPQELALPFLAASPKLMAELGVNDPVRMVRDQVLRSDVRFYGALGLCHGVDPDRLIALCWDDPLLRGWVLNPALGKPSLASQRRLLEYQSNPSTIERSAALSHLASWYGEWSKKTTPRWDESAPVFVDGQQGAFVIDGEADLWAFWRSKLGAN
jgi:hypothetical protein